eukprot:g18443.t1
MGSRTLDQQLILGSSGSGAPALSDAKVKSKSKFSPSYLLVKYPHVDRNAKDLSLKQLGDLSTVMKQLQDGSVISFEKAFSEKTLAAKYVRNSFQTLLGIKSDGRVKMPGLDHMAGVYSQLTHDYEVNVSSLEAQPERTDMEERMIDVLKASLLLMQEAVFVCRQKKRELEEKSPRSMTKLTPTETQLRLEVRGQMENLTQDSARMSMRLKHCEQNMLKLPLGGGNSSNTTGSESLFGGRGTSTPMPGGGAGSKNTPGGGKGVTPVATEVNNKLSAAQQQTRQMSLEDSQKHLLTNLMKGRQEKIQKARDVIETFYGRKDPEKTPTLDDRRKWISSLIQENGKDFWLIVEWGTQSCLSCFLGQGTKSLDGSHFKNECKDPYFYGFCGKCKDFPVDKHWPEYCTAVPDSDAKRRKIRRTESKEGRGKDRGGYRKEPHAAEDFSSPIVKLV